MNNTLTAKEWLKKEITSFDDSVLDDMMERYASYRTKELEEKIMEFRNNIGNKSKIWESWDTTPSLLQQFDEHFNITSETKEK
jgi:hypothetical protein